MASKGTTLFKCESEELIGQYGRHVQIRRMNALLVAAATEEAAMRFKLGMTGLRSF